MQSAIHFLSRRQLPGTSSGFTLIELMIVLVVASILLSSAAPPLGRMVERWKLVATTEALLSHLHLARSEAIKRNARVVACRSRDGVACAASGGWEQGWIVFHDANNNGTIDAGETVLQRMPAAPAWQRVSGNQNVARYVSYTGAGATQLVSGAFQAGTITVCKASVGPTEAQQIVVNAVGRPRIQRVTVSTCV